MCTAIIIAKNYVYLNENTKESGWGKDTSLHKMISCKKAIVVL